MQNVKKNLRRKGHRLDDMAQAPKTYYTIYTLQLTDDQMAELDMLINSGKEAYVAGVLMGRLRSNEKYVLLDNSDSKEKE